MADSNTSKLQIWKGWYPVSAERPTSFDSVDDPMPDAFQSAEPPEVLFARESFHARRRLPHGVEPFSLQWFLDAANARHARQGSWMPRLLEFTKHRSERLLGIGTGIGSDWVEYAQNGAEVIACTPSADVLALVQRNFELRGLKGRFLQAEPALLPLESASIDVACVTELSVETDVRKVADELYRVLKPGGKVLIVVRAQYDVDFWWRDWLPWGRWLRPTSLQSPPGPPRFSGRRIKRVFDRFSEHRVCKRHLRRAEVPHLLRWLPLPISERIIGRQLILKAFKPLSAAVSVPMAA